MLWLLVGWFVCVFAGMYVATQKNRPTFEGCMFGLFLGPFGVVVESMLPVIIEEYIYESPKPEDHVDPDIWDVSCDPMMPEVHV